MDKDALNSINSEEILQNLEEGSVLDLEAGLAQLDSPLGSPTSRRMQPDGEPPRRKRIKKESDGDYDPTTLKVEKEERAQRARDQQAEEELEEQSRKRTKKQSRRRGESVVSERVIELEVQDLIERIEEAMRKDISNNQLKKPAVERLQSMKLLEKKLMNRQIQQTFLGMSGLDHLEKYLFQLPDGSKPSSLLKKKVLELLTVLRLEAHHIKHNHLGQKVMALSEEKNEHSSVQGLATKLVEDWTRILMENQTDYKKQGLYQEEKLARLQTQVNHQQNQEMAAQIRSLSRPEKNKQLLPPKGKQQGFALNPSSVKIKKGGKPMSEEAKGITKLLTDLKRRKNKE